MGTFEPGRLLLCPAPPSLAGLTLMHGGVLTKRRPLRASDLAPLGQLSTTSKPLALLYLKKKKKLGREEKIRNGRKEEENHRNDLSTDWKLGEQVLVKWYHMQLEKFFFFFLIFLVFY